MKAIKIIQHIGRHLVNQLKNQIFFVSKEWLVAEFYKFVLQLKISVLKSSSTEKTYAIIRDLLSWQNNILKYSNFHVQSSASTATTTKFLGMMNSAALHRSNIIWYTNWNATVSTNSSNSKPFLCNISANSLKQMSKKEAVAYKTAMQYIFRFQFTVSSPNASSRFYLAENEQRIIVINVNAVFAQSIDLIISGIFITTASIEILASIMSRIDRITVADFYHKNAIRGLIFKKKASRIVKTTQISGIALPKTVEITQSILAIKELSLPRIRFHICRTVHENKAASLERQYVHTLAKQ
ncbi:Hypothetical_protein [Hexamita inflata]|uniref:Hypothetical_protein n=1 Tax=Hexamita inflata TaxID=28002 RepID=A0AA86RA20_9EUKA|nr:Hypothetical protein HINF_LOCUS56454 [Hexamita inflata]